jgi:hypothetical protein
LHGLPGALPAVGAGQNGTRMWPEGAELIFLFETECLLIFEMNVYSFLVVSTDENF